VALADTHYARALSVWGMDQKFGDMRLAYEMIPYRGTESPDHQFTPLCTITLRQADGTRGQTWEFDAGRRRGWIRCRTNPSFDAGGLASGFARWAADRGFTDLPLLPTLAFPLAQSRVVLEEPEIEVVTSDNAPWWANRIGRVRRIDEAVGLRLAATIIDEAEQQAVRARELAAGRST
jgi:hypothetical protein